MFDICPFTDRLEFAALMADKDLPPTLAGVLRDPLAALPALTAFLKANPALRF